MAIGLPGPPKVPTTLAQFPKIGSTGRIGSIILGILEVQVLRFQNRTVMTRVGRGFRVLRLKFLLIWWWPHASYGQYLDLQNAQNHGPHTACTLCFGILGHYFGHFWRSRYSWLTKRPWILYKEQVEASMGFYMEPYVLSSYGPTIHNVDRSSRGSFHKPGALA